MKQVGRFVLFAILFPYFVAGQGVHDPGKSAASSAPIKLLSRHYTEGENLSYHMRATNKGKTGTESYEADAIGVVKKDAAGRFFEEYQWTNVFLNTKKIDLPPASVSYRQVLSLDPSYRSTFPVLQPMLIGPILDLFTFYADLGLAIRKGNLARPGDHFCVPYAKPASWANGPIILGEDSIDFDVSLKAVDDVHHIATLVVRHVPPAKPQITIPSDWMRVPVADTPNNWVEVQKDGPRYIAAVGKETFECEMKVSLADGKMLSATMENPVEVVERVCPDATLTKCGEPIRYQIMRRIEID